MSNAVWFYTDASHQQQGPVDEAGLEQLWRDGRINGRTLVWREGQKQWLALSELALAMPWQGAVAMSAPPSLPPLPGARPAPAAVPRKNNGCMIALAIGAVLFVPIIGILAAIALPAYQDYTMRARVANLMVSATSLKLEVDEAFAGDQGCPEGHAVVDGERNPLFQSAWIGPFENGHCGVELVVADTPTMNTFAGKKIWLWRENAQSPWRCSSDIADRHLPANCRD